MHPAMAKPLARRTTSRRESVSSFTSRVFGPVPSRRLGFSLGVDVIPYKTCALDCVYCQLGSSGRPTLARRGYASPRAVLSQVRRALARKGRIDYITFSGSGEPTLNDIFVELTGRQLQ